MTAPAKRTIGLAPTVDGALRVRLIGSDPANVAQAILTGRDRRVRVQLVPGDYTAYVESLTSPARAVRLVSIPEKGGPRTLKFGLEGAHLALTPSPRVSRPSHSSSKAGAGTAAYGLPNAEPKPGRDTSVRRFSVGLSVDTDPEGPGGWVGDEPKVEVSQDPETRGLILDIERCPDWRERPLWRMTVAVQQDSPWRATLPLFEGGLRVRLNPAHTSHGPDFDASFSPLKVTTAALVASLSRLGGQDVDQLIAWTAGDTGQNPLSSLAQKMEDPWAAAAAALLLVRTRKIAEARAWIDRLDRNFAWLPDTSVANAWATAASSKSAAKLTERRCLQLVKNARTRGASPYYTLSMALAVEMLTALSLSAQDSSVRTAAKYERDAWSRHFGRRALRSGAVMALEQPGGWFLSGSLPRTGYAVVADGELSATDIHCRQLA